MKQKQIFVVTKKKFNSFDSTNNKIEKELVRNDDFDDCFFPTNFKLKSIIIITFFNVDSQGNRLIIIRLNINKLSKVE